MDGTTKLDIELPDEIADAVRARVEAGEFGSASDVVRAALELLNRQDEPRDPEIDAQLTAGYDAWKSNPAAVHTIEEVGEQLRQLGARHRG